MMTTGAPTQTVPVGTPVTVLTTCTNDGPLPAVDATCTVVEPVAPDAAGGAGIQATDRTPAMPVASLAVGGVITCTTQCTSTQPGAWTLQTTVASRTPDAIPANDVAPSAVIALAPDAADLSVRKQGPATASAGGSVVHTLSVTSHGPAEAVSVTLDDPTPAGLSFVSAGAPCAAASRARSARRPRSAAPAPQPMPHRRLASSATTSGNSSGKNSLPSVTRRMPRDCGNRPSR